LGYDFSWEGQRVKSACAFTSMLLLLTLREARGATLTPLDAAAVDASRSGSVVSPARINFVNQSASPVDIYWINFEGRRMLYRAALAVGATWNVGTSLSHRWLVVTSGTGGTTERNTGSRLAGFEAATQDGDTALITGLPGTGLPSSLPGTGLPSSLPGTGVPFSEFRNPPQERHGMGVVLPPLDAATVDG
jgi:hypothetical protein